MERRQIPKEPRMLLERQQGKSRTDLGRDENIHDSAGKK